MGGDAVRLQSDLHEDSSADFSAADVWAAVQSEVGTKMLGLSRPQ